MEVRVNEVAVYMRKYLLISLKSTYKLTCRHPFVSSFAFSLFLLYSRYPSLFAFLVSSFPVLSCTALLLGILLSYGEPNIPEIEENDKINLEVSSPKVANSLDDLFVKKDESFTLEDLVDSRVGTEERISKDSTPFDMNERQIDFLAVSSSVEEENKIVENLKDLMKEQSISCMRTCEVADSVSEENEGLMVKIKKPEFDDWLDSSLGSPWQPINIRDASSDSESDLAESSSSDASMTDILPMLDELSPLLDSETPPNAPKSADNSGSDLSQHHESDEESMEKEDENKTEEKDESNNVVTWTADDRKNVMDLGSSDLERNRRLENLIARRRARKNQIIIYEKDLIDLHSNDSKMHKLFHLHPQIPPIFAPRRNPFDFPHDMDESKGLPPLPGSAPSVLLRRQNPFDFLCDSEDGNQGLDGESLLQPEFELPSRRNYLFKRNESFASHSAFPSNLMHEKLGSSRLNPYFVAEKIDSEGDAYVDFHNQLSEKSDTKSSSVPTLNTVSSAMDLEDQKVPTEQGTQEGIALLVPFHHTKPTEQYSKFYEDDLIESQPVLGKDGHASGIVKKTSEEIQFSQNHEVVEEKNFGQNHEVVEEKHDDLTLFFSSERIEKNLDTSLDEVLETQEQITRVSKISRESTQSSDASASHLICETVGVDNNQASVPIYDSSPSGSGNFPANISVSDGNLLSSGRRDLCSVFTVESHVQEDAMENMTSEVIESKVVHGSESQDSKSNSEENVAFFTYMNLLDDNISASMEVFETEEQDFNEITSPGIDEDIGDLTTSLEIDHFSSLSSVVVDNDPTLAFFVGCPPSEVVEKHQSIELFEMQTSFGTYLEESRVSNLELGPILEENSEDFKVEEEHISLVQTNTAFASTELRMLEGSDVVLSSVGQEVVSLHNQSNEKAREEKNEAKFSKTPILMSANDDTFTGVVIGELFDSMEFSNQAKMMSEPELTSKDDISDSQDKFFNEFQINKDAILTNLHDSHSEHGDMNDDVREIQVIDEHLLSELDAVGDFQVEEWKCQECLHMESQSDSQFVCSREDSELRSAHVAEMFSNKPVSANLIDPDEMDLVLNQEEPTNSGYWSLEMAPAEDLTVYNPKLNVLQASSVEELDSIFKQDRPRELPEPPLSETIADKLEAEMPYIGYKGNQEIELIPHEAVLLMLTGKNAEDIGSALIEDGREFDIPASPHFDFQCNDSHSSMDSCKSDLTVLDACGYDSTEKQSLEIKADHAESVLSSTSELTLHPSAIAEAEISSGELDICSRDFEMEDTNSNLIVLEANSIEDIHSAFEHVTEIVVNKSISPLINPEPMITHSIDTVAEDTSLGVEKTSGLPVLEAKSAEDINSDFKQAAEESLATSVFHFSDPNSMMTRLEFEEPSSCDADNSSELFVLEARSVEDIQSVFKQATEEASAMSTFLLIDPESNKTNEDHEVVEAMDPETHNNIDLLVHEEKPYEDIDSAFEQAGVNIHKPTSQVYTVSLANLIDSEVVDVKSNEVQIDPELLVPDAKYVEGIDSSFKPSSEGGLLKFISLEIGPNHGAVKNGSLQASTTSDQAVLQAESVEEMSSNLKQVTERLFNKSYPLVDPEVERTSEVVSMISLGQKNDSDMLSPEIKYFQHLNLVCKQDIESDLVQSNLPEFGNFQPDPDAIEERPLNAIDKSEPFVLESKSFEDTHSTFKGVAADFFSQSATALLDHNLGQEVLDVKDSDSSNISDFPSLEASSLANLNLTFKQAIEGCLFEAESKVDTKNESVGESFHAADKYSELIVFEEKSTENTQSPSFDAHAGIHEGSSSLPVYLEPIEIHPCCKVEDIMCFEPENNSEKLVVEAKSLKDINSAFKHVAGVTTPPLFVDSRSLDTQIDLSSLVLEAKSIELTDSSSKNELQEGSKKSTFFPDPPLQPNSVDDFELLVIEQNSVEDIHATFVKVTEGYPDNRSATLQDDSKQTEKIPEPMFVTDSHVIAKQDDEVDYAKEALVVSNETVTGENSSTEDQIDRRTDGKDACFEDSSATSPPLVKIKKKKFEKSDSSSSSSSSSSDSE